MAELSPHSLDSFFCGLAALWLAAVARTLHRRSDEKSPWSWLAWFGLIHGLSLWLDALTPPQPVPVTLQAISIALAAGSLVALFEFGRRSLRRLSRRAWGDWIYLPLVCLFAGVVFLTTWHHQAAFAAARGFPIRVVWTLCILLAATGLWLHGRRRESPRQPCRMFRHWQLPAAAVLLIAIGWAGARWYADQAEQAQAWLVPASGAGAGTVTTAEVRTVVELEPEPAGRERLAMRRLRSSMPLLLFNLGVVVVVVAGWAFAQRMSHGRSATRRSRVAKDEGIRTKE